MKLELMYRDADNYKDYFDVEVSLKEYPNVKNLKIGDMIEMGEYGTLNENEFFKSIIHPWTYNNKIDNNLLEIIDIKYSKTVETGIIRCNKCDTVFYDEDKLKIFDESEDNYFKGCPHCETDEYLTDIFETDRDVCICCGQVIYSLCDICVVCEAQVNFWKKHEKEIISAIKALNGTPIYDNSSTCIKMGLAWFDYDKTTLAIEVYKMKDMEAIKEALQKTIKDYENSFTDKKICLKCKSMGNVELGYLDENGHCSLRNH